MSGPERCSCGTTLAAEQRYCLRCGAATAQAQAVRRSLAAALQPQAITAGPSSAPRVRVALSARQATELPLRAATLAFALVLGSAAWSAAEIVSPGTGIRATAVALAPAPGGSAAPPAPAAAVTGSGAVAAATATSTEPASEPEVETPIVAEPTATPATADAATDETSETESDAADDTGQGDAPATTDTATTPPLSRVIVLSLPAMPYESIADPAGPAPYLSGELAGKGATLRAFHAAAPTTLASNVALLSGQAPNAATLAGCPMVADVAPGTVGDDDQAAGDGCRYSTDVFTVGDLLASTDRTWRVYSEDAAGAACSPPADGAPFPAGLPAPLAFRTVADDPGCAQRFVGMDRLASDLQNTKTAPALSYAEIRGCQSDGSACRPEDPAAVDASLRRIVPDLLRSTADDDQTAILLVPSHAPEEASDRAACCSDRPWLKGDASSAGGGRTGALVLSPLVRAGSVIDGAVDHLDALKTVALALNVRAPGYAGREEVKGFPRETWERWTPSASSAANAE